MCPDCKSKFVISGPGGAAQRGFSIVTALFLLVVLAALGAFMATFSSVQHITSAQDLQGARAYQAARAGIEWGSYKVLRSPPCPVVPTTVPLAGTLAGFTVTVQCTVYGPYTEGTNPPLNVYTIVSTASQGTLGSISYVERQLQATVAK
jgi:MSHA biogenesis protein MshP